MFGQTAAAPLPASHTAQAHRSFQPPARKRCTLLKQEPHVCSSPRLLPALRHPSRTHLAVLPVGNAGRNLPVLLVLHRQRPRRRVHHRHRWRAWPTWHLHAQHDSASGSAPPVDAAPSQLRALADVAGRAVLQLNCLRLPPWAPPPARLGAGTHLDVTELWRL